MPYSRRSSGSEAEYVLMPVRSHAGSEYGGRSHRDGRRSPVEIVNNYLVPPQTRQRASSQGGGPAPTIINVMGGSEHGNSRSRSRHRDRRRSRSSSSGSSRSHSRARSRRESRRPVGEDDLPYNLRRDLDYAREQHKADEERRIQDKIKKDREEMKKRWELDEREEKIRKQKEREDQKKRWELDEQEEKIRKQKEKEAILYEAKLEEEKKKKEADELRKKILQDEEDRIKKEKEKKKAEEEEFERKVKEKFMKAGYSEEYIEEVLHKKREEKKTTLAIDLHRPTFIKVNRKYLHPDTLDAYNLPWEWDVRDSEFIIIKKYVDNELQDELFEHTRRLKEKKLITVPYVKETKTITTLTPNEYVKKGDKMYVVREKSKSPARSRRNSWMFS